MKDRFYVRLTDDEQVVAFVKEFQRAGLTRLKMELQENQGRSLKELMIESGEWESFDKECRDDGDDPDMAVKKLKEMAWNVSVD